jgi:hypothetical protein
MGGTELYTIIIHTYMYYFSFISSFFHLRTRGAQLISEHERLKMHLYFTTIKL